MSSVGSKHIVLICIVLFISPIPTYAQVYSMNVTPDSPKPGDLITIDLQSKPRNKLNITITKNRVINVTNDEFSFTLDKFEIQQNMENIQIEVKNVELLLATIFINESQTTQTVQGIDGYTKLVQNLSPPGIYWVQLSGYSTTNVEQVFVNVTVQIGIVSDDKGKSTVIYDTTGLPPGEITVEAGACVEKVLLRTPYVPRLGNIVIKPHNVSERFKLNNEYELLYDITYEGDNSTGFLIQVKIDKKIAFQETISQLIPNDTIVYIVKWTPTKSGSHIIEAIVDPYNEVKETFEEDNIAQYEINIEKTGINLIRYFLVALGGILTYITIVVLDFSQLRSTHVR
jgi:hypothetical protein